MISIMALLIMFRQRSTLQFPIAFLSAFALSQQISKSLVTTTRLCWTNTKGSIGSSTQLCLPSISTSENYIDKLTESCLTGDMRPPFDDSNKLITDDKVRARLFESLMSTNTIKTVVTITACSSPSLIPSC